MNIWVGGIVHVLQLVKAVLTTRSLLEVAYGARFGLYEDTEDLEKLWVHTISFVLAVAKSALVPTRV